MCTVRPVPRMARARPDDDADAWAIAFGVGDLAFGNDSTVPIDHTQMCLLRRDVETSVAGASMAGHRASLHDGQAESTTCRT